MSTCKVPFPWLWNKKVKVTYPSAVLVDSLCLNILLKVLLLQCWAPPLSDAWWKHSWLLWPKGLLFWGAFYSQSWPEQQLLSVLNWIELHVHCLVSSHGSLQRRELANISGKNNEHKRLWKGARALFHVLSWEHGHSQMRPHTAVDAITCKLLSTYRSKGWLCSC